ncbi:uncharacterized protein LOC132294472 isoform X1 [Cornus florida]|uniref:uncharacterized protein LOC132294472 isoform X1 n=2 Tax=Cornus florida TaxID=4283 RepID=UPI00289CC7AE|nr:uncharacterized protein LOC132294472 isoform X1 [Cornus florida]
MDKGHENNKTWTCQHIKSCKRMGNQKKNFIKLVSAAGTGYFYVKRRNPARITTKLEFRKYDPRVNCHVLFTEAKMK